MNTYTSHYVLHDEGRDDVVLNSYDEYLAYYNSHFRNRGIYTKWLYHERAHGKIVFNHLQIVRASQ